VIRGSCYKQNTFPKEWPREASDREEYSAILTQAVESAPERKGHSMKDKAAAPVEITTASAIQCERQAQYPPMTPRVTRDDKRRVLAALTPGAMRYFSVEQILNLFWSLNQFLSKKCERKTLKVII
jgi:hypothetical protein